MKTRQLNNNWDWTFGNSLNNYLTDLERLKQDIKSSLLCWVGDCFYNLDYGVDWINILGSFNSLEYAKKSINSIINKQDGVLNNSLDLYINNDRKLVVEAKVNSIYGNINIKETI